MGSQQELPSPEAVQRTVELFGDLGVDIVTKASFNPVWATFFTKMMEQNELRRAVTDQEPGGL